MMSDVGKHHSPRARPPSSDLWYRTGAPHPIPYQGSKRLLAAAILGPVAGRQFRRLFEPFAGSAAITLAATVRGLAREYAISDSFGPLIGIWTEILTHPTRLSTAYERLWLAQDQRDDHYNHVRDEFNEEHDPPSLLYLLARCVKNSPRFNNEGDFNQSPDRRRRGMSPAKMRREILAAHAILRRRTIAACCDFEQAVAGATDADLVYMDPPYQGVSGGRDTRYHQGLGRERLLSVVHHLQQRHVSVLLSYDGRCGSKAYGEPLPDWLGLVRVELRAGRSTQATLHGRSDETVESLYVSPWLMAHGQVPRLMHAARSMRRELDEATLF